MENWIKLIVVGIIPDSAVIDPAGSKRGHYVAEDVVEVVFNTLEYDKVWIVTVER